MMSSIDLKSNCLQKPVMPPFQLENADRFGAVEERKSRRIIERDCPRAKIPVRVAGSARPRRAITVSVRNPRKSILSRPRSFSGPIGYCVIDFVALRVAAERDVFREIAVADDDAGGVHADVARPAFEQDRRIPRVAASPVRSRSPSSVPEFSAAAAASVMF